MLKCKNGGKNVPFYLRRMNISLLHVLDRMESKDEELQEENIQGHLQDDIIKEALSSGLDLREYSKKV